MRIGYNRRRMYHWMRSIVLLKSVGQRKGKRRKSSRNFYPLRNLTRICILYNSTIMCNTVELGMLTIKIFEDSVY